MPVLFVGILTLVLSALLPTTMDPDTRFAAAMGLRAFATCLVAWWYLKK